MEKQLVLEALERFSGNQTRAARYLDMSRRTFAYRLAKYGISPSQAKSNKQSA
jgi:two-component system NtrC family response regulator